MPKLTSKLRDVGKIISEEFGKTTPKVQQTDRKSQNFGEKTIKEKNKKVLAWKKSLRR